MRIDVVTLFPEFMQQSAALGVVGRAQARGLVELATWNPRDFTHDPYRRVDERPYGGGPGMVMMIDPLLDAIEAAQRAAPQPGHLVYLSPQGARLTQPHVERLAAMPRLVLLCGRYEGVDERLIQHRVDEEISLGDFVLAGGELAAAALIDAVGRLQPGALNSSESAAQDSFADGLLDCPHYTRPEVHPLGTVPAVLLSGDHAAIRRWRLKEALGRTWLRRPDLIAGRTLSAEERALLEEFGREHGFEVS